jgi:GxxExxY protein
LLHGATTDRVLSSFYRVYTELGSGFLESVYKRALAVQLEELGVAFDLEREIVVHFHGRQVGVFRADLIVENQVLVELKAVSALVAGHEQQVINCLSATRFEVALLLNFGPRPAFKRFIMMNPNKKSPSA